MAKERPTKGRKGRAPAPKAPAVKRTDTRVARSGRRPHAPVRKLSKERLAALEKLAEPGRAAVLEKYKLSMGSEPFVMFEEGQPLATAAACSKAWDGLAEYCLLRGDYESLVFLDACVPQNMPSMDAATVAEYIFHNGELAQGAKGVMPSLLPGPRNASSTTASQVTPLREKVVSTCCARKTPSLYSKTQPHGSPLLDDHGRPILGADQKPIVAGGGWTDPGNIDQLLSAIAYRHKMLSQDGDYVDLCDLCLQLCRDDKHSNGCESHRHQGGAIRRRGNPRSSVRLQRSVTAYKRKTETREYSPQGDSTLTPMELCKIHAHLFSFEKAGGVEQFQLWTMLLLGVSQFLRSQELCTLTIDSFVPSLSKVTPQGTLLYTAIHICGKTDDFTQMVWRNDKMPQLCPLRHLLAWISLTGIKEGHVFRSAQDVDAPMPYTTFNERIKKVCREVCRHDGPWGTHTMPKSAYFMAVARGGDVETIMDSARHKTFDSAQRFYQDAKTVLAIARLDPESMKAISALPKWTAIHIVNHNTSIAIANNQYAATKVPICDLADCLVRSFGDGHQATEIRRRLKPLDLARAILKSAPPEDDVVDMQLDSAIDTISDPKARERMRKLVALKCAQLRTQLEVARLDTVVNASSASGEHDVDMSDPKAEELRQGPGRVLPEASLRQVEQLGAFVQPQDVAVPKPKRGGTYDAPSRSGLSAPMDDAQKLDLLCRIDEEIKAMPPGEALLESCRVFDVATLKPLMRCLNHHFKGVKADFLQKHKSFKHSTFKTRCCNGTTDACTTENPQTRTR